MKSKKSYHEHCPACDSECITYLTGDWDVKDSTTYDYECVCDNCDEDCVCKTIFRLLEATKGV